MRFFFIPIIFMINAECNARRNHACSSEFSLLGSKCYYFSQDTKSWNDAYYECLNKNSSLVVLENKKEEVQVRKYFKNIGNSRQENRWVGGKFDWKKEVWVWAETGLPIAIDLSSKGLPSDTRFSHWTCLSVQTPSMNKWSSESCLQQNSYICQKMPRYSLRRKRKFDIRICKRKQLSKNQKAKCIKLIGGYGGVTFPNAPAPIIQTPKPTTKHTKVYVCPHNMFVIRKRCYSFSNDMLNWNEAYWACRDQHSYLAAIYNKSQDKLLRRFLSSGLVGRHERWLGGLYDWKKKWWIWANSGDNLKYLGFAEKNHTGSAFEWRGIIMDPKLGNMWNSRLRTEKKHYICHRRAKSMAMLGDFNTDISRYGARSNSIGVDQELGVKTNHISQ